MGGADGRSGVDFGRDVVIAMIEPITKLATIHDAVSEDQLFQRALLDFVEAATRFALVGRSMADAIKQLDHLREQFERARR